MCPGRWYWKLLWYSFHLAYANQTAIEDAITNTTISVVSVIRIIRRFP